MEYFLDFLGNLSSALVSILKAFEFTIGGITFNWLQLFIWLMVASALIWFIKKLLD